MPRIVGMELRARALTAFSLNNPQDKVRATQTLFLECAHVILDAQSHLVPPAQPGRPLQPVLLHPQDVARRSPFTPQGHAALVHAITHIEFNAINLALDAAWRFEGMPAQYYRDWLQVAHEEAKHFTLLRNHLLEMGYDYGDFPAHDGLWTMCDNTRHDVVARMALVPRTLEARGLDATPIIQAKLRKVGSAAALAAVAILDVILAEEVGHVAIGNRWYHWLCERDRHNPQTFYAAAALQYGAPRLKPPFNILARRQAGFSEADIASLPV
jgi:uncharacterized ferritin-like protein (DUF455 family)